MHVACHKRNLGSCLVNAVEIVAACSTLGLGIVGKYTSRLESIETTHRLAHDGGDIVRAIDGRSVALRGLSTVEIDAVVVGQALHLIHIVSHRGTYLHIERLGKDGLARHRQLKARIVERTTIAPIVVDTSHRIVETLQREQVAGVVDVVVEVHTQAIVEPIGFHTNIDLVGLLPLYLVVTDVVELGCCRAVEILHRVERCAGSIVADVVVSTDVVANTKQQIVHRRCLREPLLIRNCPSSLDAGEDAPLHSCEAQSVGVLTKAAVTLHGHRGLQEVEVAIVVVGVGIPRDATP